MSDGQIAFGSKEYEAAINDTYDAALLRCIDIIERDDFYGVAAWNGLRFFGDQLQLTPESRLLELCSGVGGPARFFAENYGCKVTGVDLSAFNHRAAVKRTKLARLDHLVTLLQGDALEISLPDASFTHVFGCESWCYFPDKVRLYQAAHKALRPGGAIAFLEAASETPVRLHTEDGLVRYESIENYSAMLRSAGFTAIRHFDTTALAAKDLARSLCSLIARRDRVLESAGAEVYFGLVELWAQFLAFFAEGKMTHCGFIALKS